MKDALLLQFRRFIILVSVINLIQLSAPYTYAKSPKDNEKPTNTFLPKINEGEITPTISQPLQDHQIESAVNSITDKKIGTRTFLSFVSDNPSEEELGRALRSENKAKENGYEIQRIVVPINSLELTSDSDPSQKETLGLLKRIKSYVGTVKVKLAPKENTSSAPTPVEKKLAILYPLKNAIVNPIAWSAHTGATGVFAVTLLSVTYGYFVSVYWHAFRVFFNSPQGLNGTKFGKFLEKLSPKALADKFNLKIPEGKLNNALTNFNGKKVAEVMQYATKKFAFDMFNGELFKIASMQGGFFTAEFHWHIFTSKLFSLSYYPVSWLEDRLVLKKLIHRDKLAKLLVMKSYIGSALGTWDLAGGIVPFLDVRPGVLLIGFNGALLISYLIYRWRALKKLGIKGPKEFKKYIDLKNEIEKALETKFETLGKRPTWEKDMLYRMGQKAENISEVEPIYEEFLKIRNKIENIMPLIEAEMGFINKKRWTAKLIKVQSLNELEIILKDLNKKLGGKVVPIRPRVPLSLKPGCLPAFRMML